MIDNGLLEADRDLFADMLEKYNTDEFYKSYFDAIWQGFENGKNDLDKYDAFLLELIEDALLSDRAKILKCLRKEKPYNLKIREMWRKFLIRFPELKQDADEAYMVYENVVGSHIGLQSFWQVSYEYEDANGKLAKDKLCICNYSEEKSDKGFHKFYSLDQVFLTSFLLNNWKKFDVFTHSHFKYEFLPIEILHGLKLFTYEEVESIFKKMGFDAEKLKVAHEEETIEGEIQMAEAIAKEAMEEEYEKNEENQE